MFHEDAIGIYRGMYGLGAPLKMETQLGNQMELEMKLGLCSSYMELELGILY